MSRKGSIAVNGQRYLIERAEGALEPVEERDVPAVQDNLDIPLKIPSLKHEPLERGAHEPLQLVQEFFHRRGIDPERGLSRGLPDRAEEPHFSHREQGLAAGV